MQSAAHDSDRQEWLDEEYYNNNKHWDKAIMDLTDYLAEKYYIPDFTLLNSISGSKYESQVNKIVELIKNTILMQQHGTMLIVSEVAEDESIRLCKSGRGTLVNPFNISDNDVCIKGISNIDRAIMLNKYCQCSGIGIILDGITDGYGDPSRGARFNSAICYISNIKEYGSALAIVISEDGDVNIVSRQLNGNMIII